MTAGAEPTEAPSALEAANARIRELESRLEESSGRSTRSRAPTSPTES